MTWDQRTNPEFLAAFMAPVFKNWYEWGVRQGYTGEELVRYTIMYTERPYGFPDLYSPAADKYVAHWHNLDVPPEPEPVEPAPEGALTVEQQLQQEREWGTALLHEIGKWATELQSHIDALQALSNTMRENAGE
jgi:hypothetical protein